MNFSRQMLDEITRSGRAVQFQGWYYDLVLDGLERSGFKLEERTEQGGMEASFYRHPDRGLVRVATSRFVGPFTFIEPDPSPEKPL